MLSCLVILNDKFVYIMPDGTPKSSLNVCVTCQYLINAMLNQIRQSQKMDAQEMISEGFVVGSWAEKFVLPNCTLPLEVY